MKNNRLINLNTSVYELCKKHPEIKSILIELGFNDIKKPGMLETVGRFMNISKGAKVKQIDIDLIKDKFYEHNFELLEEN